MPVAIAAILVFAVAWLVAAVLVADWIGPVHWSLQAAYFIVVGFVWVFPVRWMMLWSVHQR